MKNVLSIVVAFVLTSGSALAADMAVKAPPPSPYNWTGIYIGGQIGSVRDSAGWFEDASGGAFAGFKDDSVKASSWLAGAQAGYNYQAGWAVFGVQADASGANMSTSSSCFLEFPAIFQTCSTSIKALGTVTGRIGAAFDKSMVYVLGGWAWEREKLTDGCSNCFIVPGVANYHETAGGWTVGAGFEYALTQNWSAFVQYNHVDFGTRDLTFVSTLAIIPNFTENIREHLDIVKLGINYRFATGPIYSKN